MHAIKVSWVNQTFALAKSNDSRGKKSRTRKSKEERKTMVETFIKRYQTSNNGSFPSLNLTHKEVGGSFYTVREIVREIIQENRILGPASSSSQNGDVTCFSVQNVLSLPPTIDLSKEAVRFVNEHETLGDLSVKEYQKDVQVESKEALRFVNENETLGDLSVEEYQIDVQVENKEALRFVNEHETLGDLSVEEYQKDVQVESKEVSTDSSTIISRATNLTMLENVASPCDGLENEIAAVSEVVLPATGGSKAHVENDTIFVKSLDDDLLTDGSNDTYAHNLISDASCSTNDTNLVYSFERYEGEEGIGSMRVGFTSSMVEETETVNDAADISNCISLTSNQATLSDCDVQESHGQNAEITDVQVEDTVGTDVNPAPQIIEKHILKNAEPERRPRNVEEGNYHSDGTRRLNFVLAIAPCLTKYIMILWVIRILEKAIFKSKRDESPLGFS